MGRIRKAALRWSAKRIDGPQDRRGGVAYPVVVCHQYEDLDTVDHGVASAVT